MKRDTLRGLFLASLVCLFGVAACEKPAGEEQSPPAQAKSEPAAEDMSTPPMKSSAAETEAKVCGGIAGIPCGEGEYCDLGAGNCQVADAQGTCRTKPEICTMEYMPVCGCDGKTYGNACEAAVAGVNIAAQGPCSTEAAPN